MYVYCLFLVFKYEITEPKDEPFGNHGFFYVFLKKTASNNIESVERMNCHLEKTKVQI